MLLCQFGFDIMPEPEILRSYPGLTMEDVLACLAYAQEGVINGELDGETAANINEAGAQADRGEGMDLDAFRARMNLCNAVT